MSRAGGSAGRGRDLVAYGAILAAALWGTWLVMRAQLDLGAGWTDGTQQYRDVRGERIRYAVWDAPVPLPESVNGLDAESRPTLSPDGRWMVFAVGERGLNADLFVAELVGGEPRDPRPLDVVNSASDELAPSFGPDALYFASDRGGSAFGLDLWRAPYADGSFAPPEPVGSGINTPADETDPCPVPGTGGLLFASNRARGARVDFDLYHAARTTQGAPAGPEGTPYAAAARRFEVERLTVLATPFDEREPALSADGRTLLFASDRDGSLGGFDLFRSFREEGDWLPPEPLVGINGPRSERGPQLTADGFALYFDVEGDGNRADLWRATSRELFRLPTPPLGLAEVIGILLLLLLALLAWLSRRWRTIDVLYRCLLISLLIHFLMMWYLREVYPESEPVRVAASDRVFRVKLAASATGQPARSRERAGELDLAAQTFEASAAAPSRAESGVRPTAAAPASLELAAPRRELEAPARREANLSESRREERVEAALRDREAPVQRYAEEAPGLAMAAPQRAEAPTPEARAAPNRAAREAVVQSAEPTAARREATRLPQDAEPRPTRPESWSPGALSQADRTAPHAPDVAPPRETFAARQATAPALTLPELARAEAPERQAGRATRHELSEERAFGSEQPEPAPTGELLGALAARERPELPGGPSAPALTAQEASARNEVRGDPSVEVRQVHESPAATAAAQPAPSFDATSDLIRSRARPGPVEPGAPRRFDVSPTQVARSDAVPSVQWSDGLDARRDPLQDGPVSRREDALERPVQDAGPEVSVRTVEEAPAGARARPEARRFDPLAELAPTAPRRFERPDEERARPERFQGAPAADRAPRPVTPAPLALAPPEPPSDAPEAADRRPERLQETPYRNRFGTDKLRALEEFGGGAETERAVAAGLAYLASKQERSGAWGQRRDYHRDKYRDVRVGKTALALLAFLGAGHTPQAESEYSGVAERAIQFLLGVQDDSSGHFGDCSSYGHGIATYALAECYALTRDERLRGPIERGVARILAKQDRRPNRLHFGGWGYYFRDDSVWDGDTWPRVSVSAWQVMALESAKLGGVGVPDRAFEDARAFLLGAWDARRGAFRYAHDPERLRSGYPILPASTPAALFGLSLLGVDAAQDDLATARRFVLERTPRVYDYRGSDAFVFDARGNLYFWYYATLAMFRVGGSEWRRWNAGMKETLLEGQARDGSWRPLSVYTEFAGDEDDERSYTTAMCVLTLEVYYRYFTPLLIAR